MSQSAHVESLDLLQRFQAALVRFGVDAQTALSTADREIRRVTSALEERLDFWQQQVIKRREEMAQARAALSHARAMHDGKSVGCIEQELTLRKTQERLREAEAKVVTVRRWQLQMPNLLKDYEGPARVLSGYVEADLRQSAAVLEGKIATLEAYLATMSPSKEST